MDFTFKVEKINSEEEIFIERKKIIAAEFKFDSPNDSETKSSKMSAVLTIQGKIQEDIFTETKKLLQWSLLPSSDRNVYRRIIFKSIDNGKIVRDYVFTAAFIVDYSEEYPEGKDSKFTLILKQRQDKFNEIQIEGDYPEDWFFLIRGFYPLIFFRGDNELFYWSKNGWFFIHWQINY